MQFAPAERERHKIALPIRNNGVARTKRILLYYRVVQNIVHLEFLPLTNPISNKNKIINYEYLNYDQVFG